MRLTPLALSAALVLAACDEKPPADPTTTEGAPATVATTNAKVEPVPGSSPAGAAPSETPTPEAGAGDADPGTCGADKAAAFVGRQDRPTTRADLVKAVGHDRIRWIGPGDAMTMDYSEGRLNVMLGEDRRLITGVRCG